MSDATQQVTPPEVPDHELVCCVGRGSYGEVWLAKSVMGTFRAVKIVSRHRFDHDRPFERELAGIQKFEPVSRTHPGLVGVLHVGRNVPAGYFYYVMEVADDRQTGQAIALPHYAPRTLRSELAQRGRLPVAECVQIGTLLTAALAHLHAHGLVHRDIKPSNIIFVKGVPKFADIGLVTDIGEKVTCVGTEGYMPPEGPGSPAADLYSLGKVLYEISMGKDCERFPELPSQLRELREAPQLMRLNTVVLKACEHDLRKRYRSALEMQAALVELAQSFPGHALAPRLSQEPGLGSAVVSATVTRTDQASPLRPRRLVVLNTSHLGSQTLLLEKLATGLDAEGCELFWDQQTTLTVAWARELESQVRHADAILALLSAGAADNDLLRYGLELASQAARQQQHPPQILPVRVQFSGPLPRQLDLMPAALPVFQWEGPQDHDRLVDRLRDILKQAS